MKRLAAHYVLLPNDRLLKQHYIELDDAGRLLGVFPLNKETASTVFYNGVLEIRHREGVSPKQSGTSPPPPLHEERGGEVEIYLLTHIHLLPPKFSANDCRNHSHIQKKITTIIS